MSERCPQAFSVAVRTPKDRRQIMFPKPSKARVKSICVTIFKLKKL